MEGSAEKECVVFEGEKILLEASRGRFLPLWQRIAVWGVCLLAAVTVWMISSGIVGGAAQAVINVFGNGAPTGGELNGGEHENDETDTDTEESDSRAEMEDSEGDSAIDTENEDEPSDDSEMPDAPKENSVSVDLSLAERGDAYIINYSGFSPDAEGLLEMGFSKGKYSYSKQPAVLILHTHTDEGYADMDAAVPLDALNKSVITVGEAVAAKLNSKGIPSVHCTVIHGTSGNGAYADAAETIRDMLRIYPSIEYVIDLHRLDDVNDEGLYLRTQSAVGTGQVRLTVSHSGILRKDTLALALSLRRRLNSGGERLCLPVVYTDSVFNSTLVPYYMKLDVGAKGNLTAEAIGAGERFAEELAELLKK